MWNNFAVRNIVCIFAEIIITLNLKYFNYGKEE